RRARIKAALGHAAKQRGAANGALLENARPRLLIDEDTLLPLRLQGHDRAVVHPEAGGIAGFLRRWLKGRRRHRRGLNGWWCDRWRLDGRRFRRRAVLLVER